MPVNNGTITGNAVLGFRGHTLISAMQWYLSTDGKSQYSRVATPAHMRAIASEFTGKLYPRSRKGLETALADMLRLRDGKTLDELGETVRVNQAVGGIAADLQQGEA